MSLKTLLISALLSISTGPLLAWSETGHRVVGSIAENYLSSKAKKAVHSILKDESLAEASTWPDEIRSNENFNFSAPWHYVEISPGTEYQPKTANKAGDVLTALEIMENILRSKREPIVMGSVKIGKAEALKFLVHLVGDIHQPLHVGNGSDKGANDCLVKWFGETRHLNSLWNLHSVWDEALVESMKLSYSELAKFIDHDVSKIEIKEWQSSNSLTWAKESQTIRPLVYPQVTDKPLDELHQPYCKKYPSPGKYGGKGKPRRLNALAKKIQGDSEIPDLGYEYKAKFLPIVKSRLLKAGIRLAGVLNAIYQ